MNTKYGKIVDNNLIYAPDTFKLDIGIVRGTPYLYHKFGYYDIIDIMLEPKENYIVEIDKFDVDHKKQTITIVYKYTEKQQEIPQRNISKLFLKIALIKINKIDAFENLLSTIEIDIGEGKTINGLDAWNDCVVIKESDPIFAPYIKNIKEYFDLSDKEYEDLMNQCIDRG